MAPGRSKQRCQSVPPNRTSRNTLNTHVGRVRNRQVCHESEPDETELEETESAKSEFEESGSGGSEYEESGSDVTIDDDLDGTWFPVRERIIRSEDRDVNPEDGEQRRNYESVNVLLLTFDYNDLGLEKESAGVKNAFQRLGYSVTPYQMPMKNTWPKVKRKLNGFLRTRENRYELRIIYYHGHGSTVKYPNTNYPRLLLSSHNTPKKDNPEYPPIVRRKPPPIVKLFWHDIAKEIEKAECDTLAILDCCLSGAAATTEKEEEEEDVFGDYRREMITATCWDGITSDQMSPAMWTVLNKSLLKKGDSISIATLVRKMNNSLVRIGASQAHHCTLQRNELGKMVLPRLSSSVPIDEQKFYDRYRSLNTPGIRLRNRKALVLGGDCGIGRSVAIAFALEGATVTIAYFVEREEDALSTKLEAKRLGAGTIKLYPLTRGYESSDILENSLSGLGGDSSVIDIVVNNLGYKIKDDEEEPVMIPALASGLRSSKPIKDHNDLPSTQSPLEQNNFITTALDRMNSEGIIINTVPLQNTTDLLSDKEYNESISITKHLTGYQAVREDPAAVAIFPGPDSLLLTNEEQALKVLNTFVSAASTTNSERKDITGKVLEIIG
ncbi:hypothetical protein AOL_s00176g77 [Orbilia oligospora ATCC 24927]|uniref:Uncharacterized protein n=1 Tax=Arthrobotrys oligospora (strain ATCC 24927 / CBS 115.81 / DSM 1491) TaxID=756982 RepID=G1XPV2_ARTOA|nr:hypothetical protein AOL_s00176g77 [Orbilia oligospora ATCC 24927]EGX44795.1 hypothetical protein AOL_s00176g77 [Orbilia oligospora ATCC 24927]